jgi:hypothetical protein
MGREEALNTADLREYDHPEFQWSLTRVTCPRHRVRTGLMRRHQEVEGE